MVKSSPCPWLEVLWVLYRAGRLSPKLLSSDKHENTFFFFFLSGKFCIPESKRRLRWGTFWCRCMFLFVCFLTSLSTLLPTACLWLTPGSDFSPLLMGWRANQEEVGGGWVGDWCNAREKRKRGKGQNGLSNCTDSVLIPSNPPHLRLCHLINQWN